MGPKNDTLLQKIKVKIPKEVRKLFPFHDILGFGVFYFKNDKEGCGPFEPDYHGGVYLLLYPDYYKAPKEGPTYVCVEIVDTLK